MDENTNLTEKKRDLFSRVFEWAELFALYFAIGMIIILACFRHSPVEGSSMYPTLNENDVLIVSRLYFTPKCGDIIICQSPVYGLERPLVKRVIAVAGQTVEIDYDNWTVSVDGTVLDESYINRESGRGMLRSDYLEDTFTVPQGCVFVMGDNRNHSNDSRFSEIGMIDERYILGKVCVKIYPIGDFSFF
mgnify:CR=1 FL=1